MKKALLLISVVLCACNNLPKSTDYTEEGKAATIKGLAVPVANVNEFNWTYDRNKDIASKDSIYSAHLVSINSFSLSPPNEGEQHAFINVKNKNHHNTINLFVVQGTFQADNGKESRVKISFDGQPAKTFVYSVSNDLTTDMVFTGSADALLKTIKESKNMTLNLPLIQDRSKTINFDVAGFKWKY